MLVAHRRIEVSVTECRWWWIEERTVVDDESKNGVSLMMNRRTDCCWWWIEERRVVDDESKNGVSLMMNRRTECCWWWIEERRVVDDESKNGVSLMMNQRMACCWWSLHTDEEVYVAGEEDDNASPNLLEWVYIWLYDGWSLAAKWLLIYSAFAQSTIHNGAWLT